MSFYEAGAAEGDFESGVRTALQAILASPHFVFRLEEAPEVSGIHRLNDLDLASRLSFFLWATVPDDELLEIASEGRLKDPAVLKGQVERMLGDPRSDALATRFMGARVETIRWDLHTISGYLALALMAGLTLYGTAALLQKREAWLTRFPRLAIPIWVIWFASYITGVWLGVQRVSSGG